MNLNYYRPETKLGHSIMACHRLANRPVKDRNLNFYTPGNWPWIHAYLNYPRPANWPVTDMNYTWTLASKLASHRHELYLNTGQQISQSQTRIVPEHWPANEPATDMNHTWTLASKLASYWHESYLNTGQQISQLLTWIIPELSPTSKTGQDSLSWTDSHLTIRGLQIGQTQTQIIPELSQARKSHPSNRTTSRRPTPGTLRATGWQCHAHTHTHTHMH